MVSSKALTMALDLRAVGRLYEWSPVRGND